MSAPKKENIWLNLGFNVVVPALLLSKGKAWLEWDAKLALAVALAFPVVYFFYDLAKRKKINWISILGFVGVLLTGGVGLFELDKKWIIVKETSIPLIIGVFVLGSVWMKKPLARLFLYNDSIFDLQKIDAALFAKNNTDLFNRLLKQGTLLIAFSFFVSAVLNCLLAVWIVQSPAGTDAFNEELGKMMAVSYPVIMVPCMIIMVAALMLLIKGLTRLTGLSLDECIKPQK